MCAAVSFYNRTTKSMHAQPCSTPFRFLLMFLFIQLEQQCMCGKYTRTHAHNKTPAHMCVCVCANVHVCVEKFQPESHWYQIDCNNSVLCELYTQFLFTCKHARVISRCTDIPDRSKQHTHTHTDNNTRTDACSFWVEHKQKIFKIRMHCLPSSLNEGFCGCLIRRLFYYWFR